MSQSLPAPNVYREALLAFAAAPGEARHLPEIEDWSPLLQAAQIHGLVSLAYRRLAESDAPGDVKRLFRLWATLHSLRLAQQEKAMGQVLGALETGGVATLVLKGPALARTVYPHPSLRPHSDLDVLIHEEDWKPAHQILERLDYRAIQDFPGPPPKAWDRKAYYHTQYVRESDNTMVEVHYDPWWYGLRPHLSQLCWQRARPLAIDGAATRMLPPEDQLLHACIHLHHHGYNRLVWFTDLALLIQRPGGIDWPDLVASARREGLGLLVYYSLHYLALLLGTIAPPWVMKALKPNALQAWVHDQLWPPAAVLAVEVEDRALCDFHEVPDAQELFLNFLLTGRRWEKLVYLGHLLVPSSAWLSYYYGVGEAATLRRRRIAHAPRLLLKAMGELAKGMRHGLTRHPLGGRAE